MAVTQGSGNGIDVKRRLTDDRAPLWLVTDAYQSVVVTRRKRATAGKSVTDEGSADHIAEVIGTKFQ